VILSYLDFCLYLVGLFGGGTGRKVLGWLLGFNKLEIFGEFKLCF
jgi:hypothetical protein